MPTPERLTEKINDIFNSESPPNIVKKLIENSDLRKILVTKEKCGKTQVVFVSEKPSVSIDFMDDIQDVSPIIKGVHEDISWCHIPESHWEWYETICRRAGAEISCIFSKEPSPEPSE